MMFVAEKPVLPACKERCVELTVDDLEARRKAENVFAVNFRYSHGAYVTAEGSEECEYGNYENNRIFSAGGHVFGGCPSNSWYLLYEYTVNNVYYFPEQINAIASYHPKEGGQLLYAVSDAALYAMDRTQPEVAAQVGGERLGVYHERLFVAQGETLRYSEPLAPTVFESDKAGSLRFAVEGGKILALIPYDDFLYVFREREILKLQAKADDVDFSVRRVEFEDGEIVEGSVCLCGDSIVFCTAHGVWYLDESGANLAFSEPDGGWANPRTGSAAYRGTYFTEFSIPSHGTCLIACESRTRRHWIKAPASKVAGGSQGVFFINGNKNLKLTEQGFPLFQTARSLLCFTLRQEEGKSAPRIVGGVIYGDGPFDLVFLGGKQEAYLYDVGEGKFYLPHAIGGTHVDVQVIAKQVSTLKGIKLFIREE